MLLKRVEELGFVEKSKEQSSIAKFPIDSQKTIISECVTIFQEKTAQKLNLNQAIDTVKIFGCGLVMPLEEVHLIQQITNILCCWLLDPSQILNNFEGDAVAFQSVIIKEFSGLFEIKYVGDDPKKISELQQHVDICRKVLNAFLLVKFPEQSAAALGFWRLMSCILIGICDELLLQPVLPYCYLSDELAEFGVSVLFELLLREGMFCSLIWSKLKERFVGWLGRIPVAICWCTAIYALSERLIDNEKEIGVMYVSWRGHLKEFVVYRDFVKFAWYQFAFLINSPKTAELYPSVLVKLIAGIERVIQVLLPKSQANTLFGIFGKPLCQAIFKSGCRDGRANALSILGQIFGRTSNMTIIRPEYLQIFFACLRKALSNDESTGLLAVVMIILNAENLLNLPGARILLPELVKGCKMVLQPDIKGKIDVNININDLFKCTYRLLAQIHVIMFHFGKDGHESVLEMLTNALLQESDCNNVVYLFNILSIVPTSISPFITQLIVKKLAEYTNNPFECSLVGIGAVSCLRGLSELNEESSLRLIQICKTAIKRNDLATEGKFIVMLFEFLIEKCNSSLLRIELIKLIALVMGYFDSGRSISSEFVDQNLVLGREATMQHRQLEEDLRDFAESSIWNLFGGNRNIGLLDQSEWPNQKHFRFSSDVGNILLSLAVDNEQTIKMIIRNKAGRFVWYFRNQFNADQDNIEFNNEFYELATENIQVNNGEEEFVDLYNDQNINCPIKPDDKFVNQNVENQKGKTLKIHTNRLISIENSELPRLLLIHLGTCIAINND
jgi:hypothetical protein